MTAAAPDVVSRIESVPSAGDAAQSAALALDAAGLPLPLSSRPEWMRHRGAPGSVSLAAVDASGRCLAMLAVQETASRALPGFRVLRLESVGDFYAGPAGISLLEAAVRLARAQGRVLRLVVELTCRSAEGRAILGDALKALEFQKMAPERIPVRTLVVELAGTEESILASFGRSTRQNIRGAAKHGLTLSVLDDPGLDARMNELLAASLARTGAALQKEDWEKVMKASAELPHRSRLIGAFHAGGQNPPNLVGFAWGRHHGDRVEYHTGASARLPGVRLPILYPVLWDLICWGRQNNGQWFDLGGVTEGTVGSDDALGGISDFKRGFSKNEIVFGEEWALEVTPLASKVASLVSAAAKRVRR